MSESGSELESNGAEGELLEAVVNAETLQTTVALVGAVVDECHVYFDADGIRIPAMDPATVAAVDLRVERAAFEVYEASDVHFGVDVSRLSDIVGIADREQLVSLELDSGTRKLEIRIGELTYTLALLDPDTVRSPPDKTNLTFEFSGGIVTDAEAIDRAVQAADMVSNHVMLGIDDEADIFYADAEGDTDDVSFALSANQLAEFTPGDARSLFSIDYLKAINRAMPRNPEIDLELGTDMPLAIRYAFAEGSGSVEYLVSPRIAAN